MNYPETKQSICGKDTTPFVCIFEPFVSNFSPVIRPLICKKIPFVCNVGFTLIELIITITIIGILAAIAVPSMNRFIESNRLVALTNDMIGDINVARSEAIKKSVQVGLCATSGSNCGASTNWGASGWRVFLDADISGTWSTGDNLLRDHDVAPINHTVTAPSNIVIFTRLGGSGLTVDENITICNTRIHENRTLTINPIGRVTITQGTC